LAARPWSASNATVNRLAEPDRVSSPQGLIEDCARAAGTFTRAAIPSYHAQRTSRSS
jgi:hypothetical protein